MWELSIVALLQFLPSIFYFERTKNVVYCESDLNSESDFILLNSEELNETKFYKLQRLDLLNSMNYIQLKYLGISCSDTALSTSPKIKFFVKLKIFLSTFLAFNIIFPIH